MAEHHVITAKVETVLINKPLLKRQLSPDNQRLVAEGTALEVVSAQCVGFYVEVTVKNPPSQAWKTVWAEKTDWDWGGLFNQAVKHPVFPETPAKGPPEPTPELEPEPPPALGFAEGMAWVLAGDEQTTFTEETKKMPIIKAVKDTKLGTKPGATDPSQLGDVKAESYIEVDDFDVDQSGQIRLELATKASDGSQVFYGKSADWDVESLIDSVSPYLVHSGHTTWLKIRPEPSALLDESKGELIKFPSGQDLAATSYSTDTSKHNNHVKITFCLESLPHDRDSVAKELMRSKQATWYLWPSHIKVHGSEANNTPGDTAVAKTIVQKKEATKGNPALNYEFGLPGFSSKFNMMNPIIENGRMSWAEALHFDASTKGYRPPEDSTVVNNIVKLAKFIESDIRPLMKQKFGVDVIQINSWYRDPATNAAVGGSSQSRHMWGDAIDFVIPGVSPYDVNDVMEQLASEAGLASASCFTHFDMRGYAARWSYGF